MPSGPAQLHITPQILEFTPWVSKVQRSFSLQDDNDWIRMIITTMSMLKVCKLARLLLKVHIIASLVATCYDRQPDYFCSVFEL